MTLLLSAHSDPSKISIAVPWVTLLRIKGLTAAEKLDGAGLMLSKREGQVASGGLFQIMFPCDSDIKSHPMEIN